MAGSSREARLNSAFLELTEQLTSDYDVVEMLHALMGECLQLLDVQACGLLLSDGQGHLELVASTSEAAAFVEMMQLNASAGPCVECFSTGHAVSVEDIERVTEGWQEFQDAALQHGFHSAHAVPLRVRSEVIGALGLFRTHVGGLSEADGGIAHALANIASLGVLQERLAEGAIVAQQLQRALDSRVVIEQAKGVVSASVDVDVEEAFAMLRAHARRTNTTLRDVAQAVVARELRIAPGARTR